MLAVLSVLLAAATNAWLALGEVHLRRRQVKPVSTAFARAFHSAADATSSRVRRQKSRQERRRWVRALKEQAVACADQA